MIKKIRTLILTSALLLGVVAVPVLAGGATVNAGCGTPKECLNQGKDATTPSGDGARVPLEERIKTIVNILLFVIGAIAVIMIVIGGIRYVISNGDQAQLTSAKNTILYAVIGIIVALLAYAIVNFVINQFIQP